jgi:hypothetical protein|nr:MAG TPA: Ribbon-helix-helix domain [Caudoviricetes sp.]
MDDFKEEFKKIAEEKGMTCDELAKKVIDMFTDEEGCMSFGKYVVEQCNLNETPSRTDPETSDQRRVLGCDLSMGDDMTHF